MGNSGNEMFDHILANMCTRITTSTKLPLQFHNAVESRVSDTAIRFAVYNFVLDAHAQNKGAFIGKVKQSAAFKNLAPTALLVS
jgi:hypothetical protein